MVALDDRVTFPAELPISARALDIADAIAAHQVIIIAGETGSGKTTQLPKICLAMGYQRIGCTQPRRIAATSVAARVAQELQTELGEVVGYKVRFNDRLKPTSNIKFMTDGILLAEIQSDPLLRAYDVIIIDEAHERSLNIDFLLGFLKRLLPRRRDLRVIVSSATLETERFATFFGGAPVVSVSGRTFPVDVLYRPPREDEPDIADAVANTVNEITEMDPRNDVLVFLPGEREIRESMAELEQRALPHTTILPLYARLSAAEQQRVFARMPGRRVILATNVAETSLTIPGIVYVVDAGLARVNRYSVRTGVTQLHIEPISRASADQRKGRCGRTANGVCFRLFEEQDFLARPSHTDPEIKRVGLAGVILRMKSLRLGDLEGFPFLDPPAQRAIDEGYRVLEELGALDERGDLTQLGVQLGRLPVDPRLGRMILGGRDENALREVLVIAAALGLQDPRERPQAAQQKADEAHRKFQDEGSDFVGYLKLWDFWVTNRARSKNQRYKLCRENFLNYNRMREWEDIHEQLRRGVSELGFSPSEQPASGEAIHRALMPGLLSKLGLFHPESRMYIGARAMKFAIHPGSGLARKPPAWVMAAELVETTRLYARTVAKIDPVWIERAAGSLVRRSYGDPHWEMKPAQVVARENISLYGLPIANRKTNYSAIDPVRSRELFILHALVRGEYVTKGAFAAHNQQLLADVERMRDKARVSGMLADEYTLVEIFEQRIPPSVVSGKTFEDWRRVAEAKQPRLLFLELADVLQSEDAGLSLARFPDELVLGGTKLPLTYKFDPGEDDDGVTVTVPLAMLPQLDPDVMRWMVPGWLEPKLVALLESLPKTQRKALAPLPDLAHALAGALKPFAGGLLPMLERAIFERTGERIGRDQWDLRSVPQHLGFWFRIVDERDKPLAQGRDLADLQNVLAQRAKALWTGAPRERHERIGMKSWDFDVLPENVSIEVAGRRVPGYPALVDNDLTVDLKLLESAAAAAAAMRNGLRKLVLLELRTTYYQQEQPLPGTIATGPFFTPNYPLTPRRQIVMRALDEAFDLADVPRTKAAFTARLVAGRAQFPKALTQWGKLAVDLGVDVTKVRTALKPLAGKPGPLKLAVDDITSQLAHLLPPDVLLSMPAARIPHVTRYLRGVQTRLQRLTVDVMKDQNKAAAVTPLWQRWLKLREELRAKGRSATELAELEELGWLLEELRVATFAPELKTAVPVSPQRVADAFALFR